MIDPDDPGLLTAIHGVDIARAERMLPDAKTSTADRMVVVIEAQHRGRVRITCERTALRKGKERWRVWVARHAEPAPDAELGVQATA